MGLARQWQDNGRATMSARGEGRGLGGVALLGRPKSGRAVKQGSGQLGRAEKWGVGSGLRGEQGRAGQMPGREREK